MTFNPADLTGPQRRIYEMRKEGIRPPVIAEEVGMCRSNVQRIIDKLAARGAEFPPLKLPPTQRGALKELSPDQRKLYKLTRSRHDTRTIMLMTGWTEGKIQHLRQAIRKRGIELPRWLARTTKEPTKTFRVRGLCARGYPRTVYSEDRDDALRHWREVVRGEIEKVEELAP